MIARKFSFHWPAACLEVGQTVPPALHVTGAPRSSAGSKGAGMSLRSPEFQEVGYPLDSGQCSRKHLAGKCPRPRGGLYLCFRQRHEGVTPSRAPAYGYETRVMTFRTFVVLPPRPRGRSKRPQPSRSTVEPSPRRDSLPDRNAAMPRTMALSSHEAGGTTTYTTAAFAGGLKASCP